MSIRRAGAVLLLALSSALLSVHADVCYIRSSPGGVLGSEDRMATEIFANTLAINTHATDRYAAGNSANDLLAIGNMLTRCIAAGRHVIINAPFGGHSTVIGVLLYHLSVNVLYSALPPGGVPANPIALTNANAQQVHLYILTCDMDPIAQGTADNNRFARLVPTIVGVNLGPGQVARTTYLNWVRSYVKTPVGSANHFTNTILDDMGGNQARGALFLRPASTTPITNQVNAAYPPYLVAPTPATVLGIVTAMKATGFVVQPFSLAFPDLQNLGQINNVATNAAWGQAIVAKTPHANILLEMDGSAPYSIIAIGVPPAEEAEAPAPASSSSAKRLKHRLSRRLAHGTGALHV